MSALGDYYRAQAQEKIAGIPLQQQQVLTSQAQQKNIEATTGEVAANAAATRSVQGAQAGNLNADASATTAKLPGQIAGMAADTTGKTILNGLLTPNAMADNLAKYAQANQANAGAYASRANIGLDLTKLPALLDSTAASAEDARARAAQTNQQTSLAGYAEGTSDVSKGKPKPKASDTVPAMLSPGEAVLNRGAAEHMGKGVIDHLNKHGLLRMAAQKEVSGHVAALAKATGPKGKPAPGTVMHFLTGGMVPAEGGAPSQGLDLQSMISAMMASGGAGGAGAGAPAGGPPAAPPAVATPRTRHKSKR